MDPLPKPSLWLPEPDDVLLLALGKTCEEANELGAVLSRCIIQGLAGSDPKTGKPNRAALLDELADMDALWELLIEQLDLTLEEKSYMDVRARQKYDQKVEWLRMVDEARKDPSVI